MTYQSICALQFSYLFSQFFNDDITALDTLIKHAFVCHGVIPIGLHIHQLILECLDLTVHGLDLSLLNLLTNLVLFKLPNLLILDG